MNAKRIILTSAIALGSLVGFAQAQEVIEYEFTPHAYVRGQIGLQETLGEGSFGKLLSPLDIQLAGGYQINPLVGVRGTFDFLGKGKGVMEFQGKDYDWKWNNMSLNADLTFNLTNAFWGYNPMRKFDLNLIGGIGLLFASGNDEANNINNAVTFADGSKGVLANVWDGSQMWFTGRIGVGADYKINDNWAVGLEFQANAVSDKYNSKKSTNCDWNFNMLAGVKYTFGDSYAKKVVPVVVNEPKVTEVIKETVVVHDTVVVEPKKAIETLIAPAPAETMTRNVFYKINSSKINSQEMAKVREVADFMKAHPNATVHVTGYADKGTGTLAINLRLARERAAAVVKALTTTYGISASRITSSSMTDHEFQPFEDPVLNRVAICVVE